MAASSQKSMVCPVLIDRVGDLATLRALTEQAKSGSGQVVVLSGEAGIGKTRLVAEVKAGALAQGFQVVQGSCFPTDQAIPYAPLLDLLRSFLTSRALSLPAPQTESVAQAFLPLLPDLGHLIAPSPALSTNPLLDPEQEKLTQFLTGQADTSCLLLIVEDLHWSDDTSLEFLHYLARRCSTHRLLLLLSYRSDEVGPALRHVLAQLDRERLVQEISLGRLRREGVEAMLRAIFALPPTSRLELLDPVYALTDGNPFFVEEILTSLIASGEISYADGRWERKEPGEWHIPRSVQDAVELRTDRLSAPAREVLTLAAVAGRRFDFALLQELTHHDELHLLSLIKELIAAQLVVEESSEQFTFRHALTRQTIYGDLLGRERKALHRRLADTLERLAGPSSEAHLADLAYHFYEAGAWEKALLFGKLVGEQALTLFTPRAAVEHLTRAEEASSHLSVPPPPSLYRTRAQAYETLGEFELARADYELALALARQAHDAGMEWQCLLDLGFLWTSRDYSQAGQWFHRAHDLAQTLADPRLQAKSLNRLGSWLVYTGRVAEGIQAHQQALHLFEALADTRGMAETFDLLGTAHCLAGDLVTAVQVSGQAIALFRAAGDLSSLATSLSLRAGYSLSETTFSPLRTRDECVQEAAEALHLSRQITSPGAEAWALLILGYVLASFGEFGSALSHARQACTIATEIGHRQWAAAAYCALGITYLLQLASNYARDALETGLKLSREAGSTWWSIQATISLARVYLLQNELEQAEAALAAVLPREQRPRDLAERSACLVWGELALAQGQPDMALQIAQELWQTVPGAATLPGDQPIPQLLKLRLAHITSWKRHRTTA